MTDRQGVSVWNTCFCEGKRGTSLHYNQMIHCNDVIWQRARLHTTTHGKSCVGAIYVSAKCCNTALHRVRRWKVHTLCYLQIKMHRPVATDCPSTMMRLQRQPRQLRVNKWWWKIKTETLREWNLCARANINHWRRGNLLHRQGGWGQQEAMEERSKFADLFEQQLVGRERERKREMQRWVGGGYITM